MSRSLGELSELVSEVSDIYVPTLQMLTVPTEALQAVVDRFQDEARKRPELTGIFTTYSARVPQLRFELDRTKARRLDLPVSDVLAMLLLFARNNQIDLDAALERKWFQYLGRTP